MKIKTVIIGSSGHVNYAFGSAETDNRIRIEAAAPGSPEESVSSLSGKVSRLYDNWRQMLDNEKPQVAVIAPHFYLNSVISVECLQRGIHCFCEKPIALSFKELDHLQNVQQKSGVLFCAMHALRFDPAMAAAGQAVRAGLIGEPLLITAQKSYRLGQRENFFKKRRTYGGTILWVGIHAIDWVYWISKGAISEVFAAHSTVANHGHDELESSAVVLFRLQNSGQAVCSIDYLRPAMAPSHADDRLRIAGERGIIEVLSGKVNVLLSDRAPYELPQQPAKNIFSLFIDSILGAPPPLSTAEIFNVTRLALLARESADRQKPMAVKF